MEPMVKNGYSFLLPYQNFRDDREREGYQKLQRGENVHIKEADETAEPILAYGVLIPQKNRSLASLLKDLREREAYREYAFACMESPESCKISNYTDIKLFPEWRKGEQLPAACLLHTELSFDPMPKDGYALFLRYGNITLEKNLQVRDFVFRILGREALYLGEEESWKDCIYENKMRRYLSWE